MQLFYACFCGMHTVLPHLYGNLINKGNSVCSALRRTAQLSYNINKV